MAIEFKVEFWMEPIIYRPGKRPLHENRFPVPFIYSNKTSDWYRWREAGDAFQVFVEVGRIEVLKYLSFDVGQHPISYNFFREAYAKKTKFDIQVGFLLKSLDPKGKTTLIQDMVFQYSESVLTEYKVEQEWQEGRINFEKATEAR